MSDKEDLLKTVREEILESHKKSFDEGYKSGCLSICISLKKTLETIKDSCENGMVSINMMIGIFDSVKTMNESNKCLD